MNEPNKAVMAAVENMIQINEDVRPTYDALIARGLAVKDAKEEIARALLGCMWEANKGMPDRWQDVLRGLREGRTSIELFPDDLYDSGKGASE